MNADDTDAFDHPFDYRCRALESLLDRLFDAREALLAAVAAEGWSRAMVEAGFRRHRRTWRVDGLVDALDTELAGLGGCDALRGTDGESSALRTPETIGHVWPCLPGAGLTPVLFGALLGAEQVVRPSSRAGGFAERLEELWEASDLPPLACVDDDSWQTTDVVVASGSDRTVGQIRDQLRDRRGPRGWRLTAYGHRTSFAVVDDADRQRELDRIADALATDVVLWNQSGCFSPTHVVFRGEEERLRKFAATLGKAIDEREDELTAEPENVGMLAARTQARNAADVERPTFGDGFGWAEIRQLPRERSARAEPGIPHAVPCYRIAERDELEEAAGLAPHHLQGVALAAPDDADRRRRWRAHLVELGATRVCRPGELQAPPPNWWHDGRPNVLEWLSVCRVDDPHGSVD